MEGRLREGNETLPGRAAKRRDGSGAVRPKVYTP